MPMTTPTLDQVIDLAHRLPREQRGQLIARLALELATDASPARKPMTPDELAPPSPRSGAPWPLSPSHD